MLVLHSHTGDSVACVSVKKSAKQASADSEPPMTSGGLNCAKRMLVCLSYLN